MPISDAIRAGMMAAAFAVPGSARVLRRWRRSCLRTGAGFALGGLPVSGFSAYQSGEKEEGSRGLSRYAAENGQLARAGSWRACMPMATACAQRLRGVQVLPGDRAAGCGAGQPGRPYCRMRWWRSAVTCSTAFPTARCGRTRPLAQDYFMRRRTQLRASDRTVRGRAHVPRAVHWLPGEVQQAARWLQLAAEKGHAGAQAHARQSPVPVGPGGARAGHDDGRHRTARRPVSRAGSARCRKRPSRLPTRSTGRTAIALAEDIIAQAATDTARQRIPVVRGEPGNCHHCESTRTQRSMKKLSGRSVTSTPSRAAKRSGSV